jgi:hypothetical protein
LSVTAITFRAYRASVNAYPRLPHADGPLTPLRLPVSSQHGAAMNATSTGTSPVTSIRARPPCDRTTMGKSSSPLVASSPIRPLTPVSHRVTTPLRMAGIMSACTGCTELDAMVMSRNPMASSSRTIAFNSTSPLRRW